MIYSFLYAETRSVIKQREEPQATGQECCVVYQCLDEDGSGHKTRLPVNLISKVISSCAKEANSDSGIILHSDETNEISSTADIATSLQIETSVLDLDVSSKDKTSSQLNSVNSSEENLTLNPDCSSLVNKNTTSDSNTAKESASSDLNSSNNMEVSTTSNYDSSGIAKENTKLGHDSTSATKESLISGLYAPNTAKENSTHDIESNTEEENGGSSSTVKENSTSDVDSACSAKESSSIETAIVGSPMENSDSELNAANSKKDSSVSKVTSDSSKKSKNSSKKNTKSPKSYLSRDVGGKSSSKRKSFDKNIFQALQKLSDPDKQNSVEDMYAFSIENEATPPKSNASKNKVSSVSKLNSPTHESETPNAVSGRKRKKMSIATEDAPESKQTRTSIIKTRSAIKKENSAVEVKKEQVTPNERSSKKRGAKSQKKSTRNSVPKNINSNINETDEPDLTGMLWHEK